MVAEATGWIGVEAHKKSDGGSTQSARALGLWLQVWIRRGFWIAALFGAAVLLFLVMGALGPDDVGGAPAALDLPGPAPGAQAVGGGAAPRPGAPGGAAPPKHLAAAAPRSLGGHWGASGGRPPPPRGTPPRAAAGGEPPRALGAGPRPPPPPPDLPPGGPVPPVSPANDSTPIHVILSAFRDGKRCARTLGWALAKAKFPERVHFRVMQALDPDGKDDSCVTIFVQKQLKEFCRTKERGCEQAVVRRTRFWTIPLEEGMGPAHQRGLENEQLDYGTPDTFCMTLDAHMDFRRNWDVLMINDWAKAENEFAVLTAYPAAMESSMEDQERNNAGKHVDLCGYFLENGIPRGKTGGTIGTPHGGRPYFTMNWAAGLAFHRCHADRNVPVDKELKWMFTGEEINRAVRLWTHGYDLYSPSEINVFHDYGQAKQEFWNHAPLSRVADGSKSRKRLKSLLGINEGGPPDALGAFGVGTQRTLEQYVEWSTIDLGTQRWHNFLAKKGKTAMNGVSPQGPHDFCQQLPHVPVRDARALFASAFAGGPARTGPTLAPVPLEPLLELGAPP